MKKLIFTLLFFTAIGFQSRAQYITIPDAAFVYYLKNNLGLTPCMSGNRLDTTCILLQNIDTVDLQYADFLNINAVQYFDNLKFLVYVEDVPVPLPPLPRGLRHLRFEGLQTSLPPLPDSLEYLDLTGNLLTSLPTLPNTLTSLRCARNNLTALSALPPRLYELNCARNQLTALPVLPDSLIMLECSVNQITSIPSVPPHLFVLNISDNPISCLPYIRQDSIVVVMTNTLITCVPRQGPFYLILGGSGLPICDLSNSNGCDLFWNIYGKTFHDDNANCMADGSDKNLLRIKLKLFDSNGLIQQTYSGPQGDYSFDTDIMGDYSISVDETNLPFVVRCPASNLLQGSITAGDSLQGGRDFALECGNDLDFLVWNIRARRFAPGRSTPVFISAGPSPSFYGIDCIPSGDGVVRVIISGPAHYEQPYAGALTPTSVNGNVITYNVADFSALDLDYAFNFYARTDTTAHIGDEVCIMVSIASHRMVDNVPDNNTVVHCVIVTAGVDPNDKRVSPTTEIDNNRKWLTYTINYQNTGTDTAYNIYIADTLDEHLDYGSFTLLGYSYRPLVQIKERFMRFNLSGIQLPDSNVNEPASHGFIQYKIKIRDNLPLGTQIRNTAFIYFDYNEAVVTNTTLNTVVEPSSVYTDAFTENPEMLMFPNPADGEVQIMLNNSTAGELKLFDVNGRVLFKTVLTSYSVPLNVHQFSPGTYFVQVVTDKGMLTKRLAITR